jgi:tetratricopeptide (TPR) repeat protein
VLSAQRATYARLVAEHLSSLFGEEVLAQYYDVIAEQYRTAGEPRRELFYTLAAAEYAEGIYAHREALDHYQRAVELLDDMEAEQGKGLSGASVDWRLESLKGLGRVLLALGRPADAEQRFEQAIDVGEATAMPRSERLRLYYWLCEALFWDDKYEEQISVAKKGLALLEEEERTVEHALMNQEVAVGYRALGDREKFVEYTRRTAAFLDDLPYSVELRPAYYHVATLYAIHEHDLEQGLRWITTLRRHATAHHDLRALGEVDAYTGLIRELQGDLAEAEHYYQQALERYDAIGDLERQIAALRSLSLVALSRGEIDRAQRHAERQLSLATRQIGAQHLAESEWRVGLTQIAHRDWQAALSSLDSAAVHARAAGRSLDAALVAFSQAAVYLQLGDLAAARERCQRAVQQAGPAALAHNTRRVALLLNVLERAHGEDRASFTQLCERWASQNRSSPLRQWYLLPSGRAELGELPCFDEAFTGQLGKGWQWHDPLHQATHTVGGAGLTIAAPNGLDLWGVNVAAPRLLRPAPRPCIAETACAHTGGEAPAIGGLLLWAREADHILLDWGTGGTEMVMLVATLGGESAVIGRGWCRGASEDIRLRLEWDGSAVRGLCSANGTTWSVVGEATFAPSDPAAVGLYASGSIERHAYPGAHRAGTQIRFRSFRLWSGDASR